MSRIIWRCGARRPFLSVVFAMSVLSFSTSASADWVCVDQSGSIYDYYSDGSYTGTIIELGDGVTCYDNGVDSGWDSGSSGGGGGSTPQCQSTTPSTVDAYSDALAAEAATDIKARTDYRTYEYGALIYRDAQGRIRSSSLVRGGPSGVPGLTDLALQVGRSNIIGVIHNHPYNSYRTSTQQLIINRNPSANDWSFAAWIQSGGANADLLQMYIFGPDSRLREFDANNRESYEPEIVNGHLEMQEGDILSLSLEASTCP